MSSSGIGNLSTLIKRLEAATSRLEDLAIAQAGHAPAPAAPLADRDATAPAAPSAAPPASAAAASGDAAAQPAQARAPPAVEAWDADVAPALDAYVQQSSTLGGLVATQAAEVQAAFACTRAIVQVASCCQPPVGGASAPAFAPHLQPLQAALKRVMDLRENNRGEPTLFNHLSTVSEGIPALGWIAVEPTPAPYIVDMKDSAQFYANRVIKAYKEQ